MVADAVCAALERAGVRCWMAPRDVLPGDNWADAILQAIAASRVVVLIFSEHTQNSQHIRREVERAVHHGIAVAPLRIRDVMPAGDFEYYLSSSHRMDAMTGPLERHLKDLGEKVKTLLGKSTPPELRATESDNPVYSARTPAAAPAAGSNRLARRRVRAVFWAAGLLALAGLAAGAWRMTAKRRGDGNSAGPASASTQPAAGAPSAGGRRTFTNTLGMSFVEIPAGEFMMGSPDAEKGRLAVESQHRVKLTRPFFMGVHEVTCGQFQAFVNAEGFKGVGLPDMAANQPVVRASWDDARDFCAWLGKTEKRKYRLPTEAEWEYAARAGARTAYPWGDDWAAGKGTANVAGAEDGFATFAPVGIFRPNAWGLHDVIDNASEWCADVWSDYAAGAVVVDPTGIAIPRADARRVMRGGSHISVEPNFRLAYRAECLPGDRVGDIGFRVCLEIE